MEQEYNISLSLLEDICSCANKDKPRKVALYKDTHGWIDRYQCFSNVTAQFF